VQAVLPFKMNCLRSQGAVAHLASLRARSRACGASRRPRRPRRPCGRPSSPRGAGAAQWRSCAWRPTLRGAGQRPRWRSHRRAPVRTARKGRGSPTTARSADAHREAPWRPATRARDAGCALPRTRARRAATPATAGADYLSERLGDRLAPWRRGCPGTASRKQSRSHGAYGKREAKSALRARREKVCRQQERRSKSAPAAEHDGSIQIVINPASRPCCPREDSRRARWPDPRSPHRTKATPAGTPSAQIPSCSNP